MLIIRTLVNVSDTLLRTITSITCTDTEMCQLVKEIAKDSKYPMLFHRHYSQPQTATWPVSTGLIVSVSDKEGIATVNEGQILECSCCVDMGSPRL